MGGYTVTRYGEEYPDQVDYIASIAPVISGELSWEAHRRAYPGQLEEWKESKKANQSQVISNAVLGLIWKND